MTWWGIIYVGLLFIKIFFLNIAPLVEGLYGFKFNGLYVLFYFAGSYVLASSAEIRRALSFSGWMLFVTALYGLKQFLFGFTAFEQKWLDSITFTTLRIEGVVRPFSTYVSPATLSDGMCILLLLGSLFLAIPAAGAKWKGLLFSGAAFLPLLLATVRTSWAASAAGLFFFWAFLRLRQGWPRWLLFAVTLFACLGYLTRNDSGAEAQSAAFSQNLRGGEKTASSVLITSRTKALANPLQEYSIQKRMEIWGEIWFFAVLNPLGRGQGTHGYAHSYYFQVLGEIGFPGLIAFFVILFFGFKRGFQILARNPDPETAELARFCLTLLFVFGILNLTGSHLHSNPGDIFFWFSLGILARLHQLTSGEKSEPVPTVQESGHG
jgi:hypothetical protein